MTTLHEQREDQDVAEHAAPPFLRRVRIRGYKSIAFCDVDLAPLTVLVGRNASGKSNFLDALAFLRDVLTVGLHEATRRHGGLEAVPCSFGPGSVVIEVDADLGGTSQECPFPLKANQSIRGTYALEVELLRSRPPRIVREHLQMSSAAGDISSYTMEQGRVTWQGDSSAHPIERWTNADRPFLGMSGAGPLVELQERLGALRTYNFNPREMRLPRPLVPGSFLEPDGSNLASVLATMAENDPERLERLKAYLSAITQTIELVGVSDTEGYGKVRFRTREGTGEAHEFNAASTSDGTLRVLGALAAAFQVVLPWGHPSLVAIEEPETALHPAAMRALVEALDEATGQTQVLLTTHSAELLDNPAIGPDSVRVVEMIDGRTVIGRINEASREIVRRKLNTLAELERQDRLEVDPDDVERQELLSRNGEGPAA